jgi:hypothetical protein
VWWVLTAANAAGIDGLTGRLKHGGARDNTFLVTHPMTDQRAQAIELLIKKLFYQLEYLAKITTEIILLIDVQSRAHQTIHFGLCTAIISNALALISNCKCIARRPVDRIAKILQLILTPLIFW